MSHYPGSRHLQIWGWQCLDTAPSSAVQTNLIRWCVRRTQFTFDLATQKRHTVLEVLGLPLPHALELPWPTSLKRDPLAVLPGYPTKTVSVRHSLLTFDAVNAWASSVALAACFFRTVGD